MSFVKRFRCFRPFWTAEGVNVAFFQFLPIVISKCKITKRRRKYTVYLWSKYVLRCPSTPFTSFSVSASQISASGLSKCARTDCFRHLNMSDKRGKFVQTYSMKKVSMKTHLKLSRRPRPQSLISRTKKKIKAWMHSNLVIRTHSMKAVSTFKSRSLDKP